MMLQGEWCIRCSFYVVILCIVFVNRNSKNIKTQKPKNHVTLLLCWIADISFLCPSAKQHFVVSLLFRPCFVLLTFV